MFIKRELSVYEQQIILSVGRFIQEKGFDVNFDRLLVEIQERDDRDRNRAVAPLRPAPDALVVDSTAMDIDTVVETILQHVMQRIEIRA